MNSTTVARPGADAGAMILPLALAQFIATYAATNMNVAISAIASDLHTDIAGVQTAITLFTLVMAALMIPGSKLTDIWGRKRCFVIGLVIYGIGALLALLSLGLPLLIVGYSLFEGVGSALLIPPVYILITVAFPDVKSRARYFGMVSGAGGLGAAAGPLIGGLITTGISWRASFGLQVLAVAGIIWLARKITDPARPGRKPRFDLTGAVLSAAGLVFVVLGLLQSRTYGFGVARQNFTIGNTVVIPKGWISPVWLYVAIGVLILLWFFLHTRAAERTGKDVLLALRLFANRTSNLGLGTQIIQWLILQGTFFVVSVFLQEVWKYNAIQTGLILIPAILGVLATSAGADRFAARHPQRWLIIAGFLTAAIGLGLLLALVRAHSGIWTWIPGLLLFGAGVGVMVTSSVNVVQSSWPDAEQGDISGLSRSVSNLGSSLGTALVGSVLVAVRLPAGRPFAAGLVMLLVFTLIGLLLGILIPREPMKAASALGSCGMSDGEPLTGGSETPGIVRIGDTVRRPLRPFSLTVQAYLAHLRDAGFTGAPLPLGVDEQGREVLSYVPGAVHRHPLPPEAAGDNVLAALARLIRALHDASAGWVPPPGAVWGGTPASSGRIAERAELVSHRDYATGNVVFRDGLPAALIDFDLARPTSRLYDIANALWYWAPFKWGDPRDRAPALAGADVPHRVAVFADAYGMTPQQRAELAPFAVEVARRYHQDSRASARLDPVRRKHWEDGGRDVLPRAEAWLRRMAPAITARLLRPG